MNKPIAAWVKRWPDAPKPDLCSPGNATGKSQVPPPAALAVPADPISAIADALALIELAHEGGMPVLIDGRLYLQGRTTPRARAIFNRNAAAISRLMYAFASGKVSRQALASKLAGIEWTWPGTANKPAAWPGLDAFLLGVEPVRCVDCRRCDGGHCTKYQRRMPEPTKAVRCLWALPRQPRRV